MKKLIPMIVLILVLSSFTVSGQQANPEQLCTPDTQRNCNTQDQLIQCNEYGSAWKIIDDCPGKDQRCSSINGQYQCVDVVDLADTQLWASIFIIAISGSIVLVILFLLRKRSK